MDTSTIQAMESAAAALGSATKHIGAASLEIGKVVAPAARSAMGAIPVSVSKTIDQARFGQSAAERKHAAAVLGVGVACVSLLAVATFAHFASKVRKSRIVRAHKRQVTAALKRERAIDETLSDAVAMRPASAFEGQVVDNGLSFADEPGCFAILTYDPDVASSDPSAYRNVYVGAGPSMLDAVQRQLDGKGNLYVHADVVYDRPVYVALFPCEEHEIDAKRAQLVEVLGADESYNMVSAASGDE